jgi:hypothetical protein
MPHDIMRTARPNRNRAPWLEFLESRDVPSGLGNLFSFSHPFQTLALDSPVTVLRSVENLAPTTEVQPVRAVGLDGTLADLPGKSVPLDAVSLITALPMAGSVQEFLGARAASVPLEVQPLLGTAEQTVLSVVANVAQAASAVPIEVQPLLGTAEQTVLSVVANVAAIPATQGSAPVVPIEVPPLPGTAKQTLLPLAANVPPVVTPVHEQPGASAAESSALPATVSTPLGTVGNPGQQTTAPVGIVAFAAGNTRTTGTADEALFSEPSALPFFQSDGAGVSDQVAVTTTAAFTPLTPIDRGTALDGWEASGEGTVETDELVVYLPAVEGSGLLNANLPLSGNETGEGWQSLEALNGNAFFLWVFGLPASVAALVAVETVRRRKQSEQALYYLTPGWGAADVS